MARDITLDVVTRHDSKGLRDAATGLDRMATSADRADDSVVDLSHSAGQLELQIAHTKKAIVDLGEEFDRTGDRSLFGDMRKHQSTLRDLERMLAAAKSVAADAGMEAGEFFLGGMSRGIIKGPGGRALIPALVGALVVGVAAAAPAIGAMVAGLLAGAIGTVGVGGGLAMASKDPRVRAEARHFGREISKEFFRGGDAFVEPAIAALRELEDAFKDMKVPESFATMAPHVATIVKGLGDLGRNIMPGLNAAFERMGPFAQVAGEGFADMGAVLGDFADDVTDSEGAVSGLRLAFAAINGTIILTGNLLNLLSRIFLSWVQTSIKAVALAQAFAMATGDFGLAGDLAVLQGKLKELLPPTEQVGVAAQNSTGPVQSFGAAAGLAAQATGHLAGALTDAHSKFLDWAGAEIQAEAALDRMQEALDESNGSLNVHNERGRAARESVLRFAQAAQVAAEKKFDETQSVKAANAVYEGYRRQLINTLIAEGKTRAEAVRLANQWMAFAKLPNITKTITLYHDDVYREHRQGERSASGRQHGGPVLPGVPYRINEAGRETVTFPAGGTVHPANLSPVGGQSITLRVGGRPTGPLEALFVQWLTDSLDREVSRRGGTLVR